MARYSIRRLQLGNRRDLEAELGPEKSPIIDEFATRLQQFSWTMKVICREEEFSRNLLSALSLRGMACWLSGPGMAYVFSDYLHLRELANSRSFISNSEARFAQELRAFMQNCDRDEFVIDRPKCSMILGGPALLMGILNCTPDSFFDGGKYQTKDLAIARGIQLAEQGADIIDIGGESTRPKGVYGDGAQPISAAEEIERVVPVIEALSRKIETPISIDTYKAEVAEAAIQAGAGMVNDISGFLFDPRMPEVVAKHQTPVVLMHLKGTPQNMQQNPTYENLMDELYMHLQAQIELATKAGISKEQIIIDPGIGFGKTIWHNYEILRRLGELRGLGCPILVGPSRKSFVGKVLNLPPEDRLEGTAAAVALAVTNGAHILRVHDVMEMQRVTQIAELIAGRADPEMYGGAS